MKSIFKSFKERVIGSTDPRITSLYATLTDSVLLFLALMVILGVHSYIYVGLIEKIPDDRTIIKVYILLGYTIGATILVTTIISLIRYYALGLPLQKLRAAFQKIAAGDFSARLAPRRKTNKKDYLDVMFDDFNTMAAELSSIETLKTDFVSNVSHEIKTPLSVISGYAQRLKQNDLSGDERRECVDTILGASSKLSTLISNILLLGRLENQTIMPAKAPYDMGEEIRRGVLDFEDLWEKKDISFEADIGDNILVKTNKSIMQIVWNNLISNAVKFTPEGGIIRVTLRAVENAAGSFAEVTVADSGCGMDAETRAHIFDKFYQGDTSHVTEGNGLGLALAKRALDAAGGSIAVESRPGRGTVFTVRLPL